MTAKTKIKVAGAEKIGPAIEKTMEQFREEGRQQERERIASLVTLDPNDPFDAALIPMVETNRKKRADYAKDGNPFDNFETSSTLIGLEGFGPVEAALFNVTQKLARLKSLRQNGRMNDPQNEAVADTYLDMACYSVLALAIYRQTETS